MKKRFTKLMAALALLVFMAPSMVMWGQNRDEEVTYTLDGTITGGSSGYATESTITQNNVTWMVTGNTTMNPWRIGGKNLSGVDRPAYSTSSFSDNITKVVVTNGTATATVNSMTLIVSSNSDFSDPTSTITGTWTASATTTFSRPDGIDWSNKYFKLVYNITAGGSNQYAQLVKVELYKESSGNTPSISAENVDIDYNATSGSITYTINNPVTGGSLSASTQETWLTLGTVGTNVPFTCSANDAAAARTATVTLTYSYGNDNVTKDVTVTQGGNPNVINNISDITVAGTYTVQGTIVAKSTRGFIVGDGTGYVYYYNQNYTQADYNIGDMVKLAGSVVVYGGVFEFNASTTVTTATTSNYVAEQPTVLSGADMDARVASTTPPQLSSYVQYEGKLSISGSGNSIRYNITNIAGANTAIGSISYPINTDEITALDGKQVKVTGYYVGISSNTYYNTMIGSIEEIVSNDPSITADNVGIDYNITSGAIEYTINNPVSGGSLSATTTDSWLTLGTVGTNVPFTCSANDAAAARTATVTLTYTYNNTETVTKDVTVTQAGNPNVLNNISDITEVGADYHVKGMVVATSNKGFIICDGTGLVYTFLNAVPAKQIGDFVQITGTTGSYGHVIQFTNTAIIADAEDFNFDWPNYTVITEVPDYTQGYHLSDYFQFEGALTKSGSNYLVAVGESSIRISYPTDDQAADLETLLNKTVRIHGFFTGYSGSGNNAVFTAMMESYEEVVNTTPEISAQNVNIVFDATSGEIAYTVNNPASNGVMTAAVTNGDWLTLVSDFTSPIGFTCSANNAAERTATVTLTYTYDNNLTVTKDVTVTQAAYVAPSIATLPFDFDGGRADIENTDGLTQEGLGSDYASSPKLKFDSTDDWVLLHFDGEPDRVNYTIKGNSFSDGTFKVQASVDGTTFTDLATYTTLGSTEHISIPLDADVRYIKWIYTEKVNGNVALGAISVPEKSNTPSITIDTYTLNVDAEAHDGTINVTYANVDVDMAEVMLCDANGDPTTYNWITSNLDNNHNIGYSISANTDAARTAYLKVCIYDVYPTSISFSSDIVTINQAAYVPPFTPTSFTLATTIESGRRYIVVGFDGEDTYAMGAQGNNNRAAIGVEKLANGGLLVNSADVAELVINGPDTSGYYTIYDANYVNANFNGGYLYAANSSSNYLRTRQFNTDGNSRWTITFDTEDNAVITAKGTFTHNLMRFNSGSSKLFSCYAENNTMKNVFLYLKDETDPQYTFYKDIQGYNGNDGGYYLISSPIEDLDPVNVSGLLTPPYDLYWFDQTAVNEEWQNYKAGSFNFSWGLGYLYAHYSDITLAFSGDAPSPIGEIPLVYDNTVPSAGINLVGNPFGRSAWVDKDFFVLDENGAELIASQSRKVNCMEGIFVIAQSDGEEVTFSTTAPSAGNKLVLNINQQNEQVIDRAIVNLGEGGTLPKFMLNPNNTKIYIPQDDKDYAVVSNTSNVIPVNFKASENGTFTLNLQVENAELDYLHLFDNKTGADIDLLATPSYTFEANTTDYASRFSLVFSIQGNSEVNINDNFAFINNGQIIIPGVNDNATLEVIDVTGRVILNRNARQSVSTTEMTPGVYVLRLTQGENVMIQKIVVK